MITERQRQRFDCCSCRSSCCSRGGRCRRAGSRSGRCSSRTSRAGCRSRGDTKSRGGGERLTSLQHELRQDGVEVPEVSNREDGLVFSGWWCYTTQFFLVDISADPQSFTSTPNPSLTHKRFSQYTRRSGAILRWGRGALSRPDSKASWPFWRDFWGPKMLQNPNFPGLHHEPRWGAYSAPQTS